MGNGRRESSGERRDNRDNRDKRPRGRAYPASKVANLAKVTEDEARFDERIHKLVK